MSTSKDWALLFNSMGYNVIPILPMGKKPAILWDDYNTRVSTPQEIEGWYAMYPFYNVGLVAGTVSNLVMIDADSESAVKFCKLHMAPTPLRIKTRKGLHFYFRHPGGHIKTKTRIHPAQPIDIRADGGYVVSIGSVHETGYVYNFDDGASLVPINQLPIYNPEWFPEHKGLTWGEKLVTVEKSKQDKALAWLERQEGASEGGRNAEVFRLAAWLIRDMEVDPDDALDALEAWNQRCNPPLPDRELERTILSAAKGFL